MNEVKLEQKNKKVSKMSVIISSFEIVLLLGCLFYELISAIDIENGAEGLWFSFALTIAMLITHFLSFLIKPKASLDKIIIMGIQSVVGIIITITAIICNFVSAYYTDIVMAGHEIRNYYTGSHNTLWILTILAFAMTILSIVGCILHFDKRISKNSKA